MPREVEEVTLKHNQRALRACDLEPWFMLLFRRCHRGYLAFSEKCNTG